MSVCIYVMRNDYTTFTREFTYKSQDEAIAEANKFSSFLCDMVNMKKIKDYEVEVRN